jgi:hypothetical protein
VEVTGRTSQYYYFSAFGNLFDSFFSVNLSLYIRVSVNGGSAFDTSDSGVCCDCNDTSCYDLFNVRSLSFTVVGLYDDSLLHRR